MTPTNIRRAINDTRNALTSRNSLRTRFVEFKCYASKYMGDSREFDDGLRAISRAIDEAHENACNQLRKKLLELEALELVELKNVVNHSAFADPSTLTCDPSACIYCIRSGRAFEKARK